MKHEGPQKRKPCDMSTWHRVTEDDGSTVAYAPDIVTAQQIADAPRLYEENERLRAAAKQAIRVLSHIKDAPKADPLKYIPISAYTKAYDDLKAALSRAEGGE